MSPERVLVVGTTSDYIDIIRRRFPGRAIFITDPAERARASEPKPDEAEEVLCRLDRPAEVLKNVVGNLRRHGVAPTGVVCFDCESMHLASSIASALSLPYPSAEAVAACRSKFASKQLWRRAGLPCPETALVETADEAAAFLEKLGGAEAILKPLTGSGSELLFVCSNTAECARAVKTTQARLARHHDARMYAPTVQDGRRLDPRRTLVIEEFVRGTEYSCDFIVDGGRTEIIRLAKKVPATGLTAGTTLAYLLPAEPPPPLADGRFTDQLRSAARAVGLERAICMLDIMVQGDRAAMIEIAPRPGGDCLPPLIRESSGLDMLGLALDFAERRPFALPPRDQWRKLVGLRFFTDRSGVIAALDDRAVRDDPRVLDCHLKRSPGHRVVQPPENYDSRLLGHAIFRPTAEDRIEDECREIHAKLKVEFDSQRTADDER